MQLANIQDKDERSGSDFFIIVINVFLFYFRFDFRLIKKKTLYPI